MINAFELKKLPKSIAGILQLVASASPASSEQRRSALLAPLAFPLRSSLEVYCDYFTSSQDEKKVAAPSRYMTGHCYSYEHDEIVEAYSQFLEEPEARVKAVVASSLRSGFFSQRGFVEFGGRQFFERVAGWRYLAAALFATRRFCSLQSATSALELNQIESMLVSTARSQRLLAGSLLKSQESVVGDLNALALDGDRTSLKSYLLAVNCLSRTAVDTSNFVARAKSALDAAKTSDGHHVILIADNLRESSKGMPFSYEQDGNVHLVGDANKIRFVIVCSLVPEKRAVAEEDVADGSCPLSVSRLRAAFLDGAKVESRYYFLAKRRSEFPKIESKIHVGRDELDEDSSPSIDDSRSVISRTKLARRFFGYKGLPDIDPL